MSNETPESTFHLIPSLLAFLPPALIVGGSAVLVGLGAALIYRAF